MTEKTIATYTIQISGPEKPDDEYLREEQRVLANLPAMLEAAEEDLTKLLPEGFCARIQPWDADA